MNNASQKINDRYKATRKAPKQERGKERIRQILLATARLSSTRGLGNISTNDIADEAGIPVGSIYSYFSEKNEIIAALAELYSHDVSMRIDELRDSPLLMRMSWYEVCLLLINTVASYVEQNRMQDFINHVKSDPDLAEVLGKSRRRTQSSLCALMHTRCRVSIDHHGATPRPCEITRGFMFATVEQMYDAPDMEQKELIAAHGAAMIAHYLTDHAKNE